MAKHSTFMRATVLMADGKELNVLVGLCDRVAAKAKYGKGIDELEGQTGLSEEWLAYAAYVAAKRQAGVKSTFEKWLETYVGMEFDDGEESPGPTPA